VVNGVLKLRQDARAIWDAAVAAVRADVLVREAFADSALGQRETVSQAHRVVVFGGGKAGAAMALGLEEALSRFDNIDGLLNVLADAVQPLRHIELHPARPVGSNQPTVEGVARGSSNA
jgi:glycerate-2-kinase